MARAGTSPSYLKQKEIQLVEPVILERSDFEKQQEKKKQDEEEDGILEYDSPCDDSDIPSLELEADFISEEVPASQDVLASTAELCSMKFSLPLFL